MKRFRIILLVILGLFIVTAVGLYIYFNDARLKSMILPVASKSLGTEVTAESMSFSLFRNFPSVGVVAKNVRLGSGSDSPLQNLESMTVAVRIFPLLSNRLEITNLALENAQVLYVVYPDSSTNIDPMMRAMSDTAAVPDPDAEPWEVDLRHITLKNVGVVYRSAPDTVEAKLTRMDLDASVNIEQVIRSRFKADLQGLSASKGGRSLVSGISFGLDQQSVIDMDNEIVTLEAGDVTLGDFALALTGSVSNWSEALMLNLSIASSSSDFGELLNLLPPDTRRQFAGYETSGSFDVKGSVKGEFTENTIPRFDLTASITDGYLKDRKLPTAIEQVNLRFTANNDRIDVAEMRAVAGSNRLNATGNVTDPLSENAAAFAVNLQAAVDLSTVKDFYDVKQAGIEAMRGTMNADADIEGRIADLANGKFDADIRLQNGYLKYAEVAKPIEDLFLVIQATRERVDISDLRAKAGDNRLGVKGLVTQPLDSNRTAFDLDFDAYLDLATVKEFYPISEDTLTMRGLLTAKGEAKGTLREVENSAINGTVALRDGYLAYKALGSKPIEDIQVQATGSAKSVRFDQFKATAGVNRLAFTGTVTDPLEEQKTGFNVNADVYLDLATVKDYYPISADTLQMSGIFTLQSQLQGRLNDVDNVRANGSVSLANGRILYTSIAPKAFEDIQVRGTIADQRIRLEQASLRAGSNTVQASGAIANYLGDNPIADVTVNTTFNLAEAKDYVAFDPELKALNGQAVSNLTLKGPVTSFEDLRFVGSLDLNNVSVEHDSLPKPITGLQARLRFTEQQAGLEQMTFKIGASDVDVKGTMTRYMALVSEDPNAPPAELTGSFSSRFLNLDELYPMSGGDDEEVNLVLPNLNAKLTANIDSMVVFSSPVTKLNTTLESTPKQVVMRNGSFNLFDGTIRGAFTFDVLNPKQSILDFAGQLSDVRIETFFRDFPIFGPNTKLHQYVSGGINFDAGYKTALDSYLNPETPTTQSEGTFGMSQVRIRNHPVQNKIADFLKIPELKDIGLDSWTAKFKIGQSLLTLQDMKLTSRDIGLELEGVENLRNQEIAYQTKLYLPQRYTQAIVGVLPREAVDALVRPDSTILVPILVSGTMENPQIGLNQDLVKSIIDEYLRSRIGTLGEAARDRLRGLFRNQ